MAVAFGAIGTPGSATTLVSPFYPTGISASTSVLYCLAVGRSSAADTPITGPAGWTSIGQFEGGAGTWGVDAGPRRVAWFRKDTVTGSETGSVNFTFATGSAQSTLSATILRLDKTAGYTVTETFASGVDTASGTAYSAISDALTWASGDLLCIGTAQNIDSAVQSAVNVSASGVTFGTLSNRVSAAVSNGNDHRRILDTVPVTTASTTSSATYSYTCSAACSGATGLLLVRETGTPVTVALNGAEVVASTGEAAPPPSRGQAMTMAQQAVAALGVTLALVGSAITSQQGTTSPNSDGNVALIGQEVAASTGSAGTTWTQALSGSAVTSSRGDVSPALMPPALAGQALTSGTGTLSAAGESVTVNLSGVECDVLPGDVLNGGTSLVGAAATAAQGAYGLAWTVALTGIEFASATGAVFPEQDAVDTFIASASGQPAVAQAIALTGSEMTGAQGDVDITADATCELVGQAVAASAGTAVATPLLAPLGQSITAAQANMGAPGGAALTGAEITSATGFTFLDGDRSYALTGQSVSVLDGAAVTSYLAFATGQVISVQQQGLGPRAVALAGQAVTATQGRVVPPAPFPGIGLGGGWYHGHGHGRGKKRRREEEEEKPLVEVIAEAAPPKPARRATSPAAGNTLRTIATQQSSLAKQTSEVAKPEDDAKAAAEKKRKKKKAEVLLLL